MKKLIYLFLTIFLVVCCDSKPKNPIYLDANGITIKAHKWAKVGDEGIVNDVLYTIVDKQMLVSLIDGGNSYDRTCTTFIYDMKRLFQNATTSQNISHWDVSNVEMMDGMFSGSSFNQDISNWDVSNLITMTFMFYNNTAFNQDLSSWSVDGVSYYSYFSAGATSWTLPKPNFTP